jgi:hypothetical protein
MTAFNSSRQRGQISKDVVDGLSVIVLFMTLASWISNEKYENFSTISKPHRSHRIPRLSLVSIIHPLYSIYLWIATHLIGDADRTINL